MLDDVLDSEIVKVRNRLTLTISKLTIINYPETCFFLAFLMHAMRVFTFQETFQIEITKSYGMNAGCSGALLICDEKLDFCILRGEFTQFLRLDVRRFTSFSIQIYSNPLKSIASWLLLSFSGATSRIGTKTSSDC